MDDFPFRQVVSLRTPEEVMRLTRMGQAFPSRLSFLPTLLRRLRRVSAQVVCTIWNMDSNGYGHAVYSISLDGYVYSLVAIANALDDQARTDRVIADAWDSSFVLYDGIPDTAEISRLVVDCPRQEAARFSDRDLIVSRANKSVRLFDHVVDCLRQKRQPERARILDIGYLMRTTAVYGNGKFGIADRVRIADRPSLSGPFMAEMLAVWMIRGFSHDLVEHLGQAALDRDLKRHLGIGNATGLGMAPFLVNHSTLLDAWIQARETALARVRDVPNVTQSEEAHLRRLAKRALSHLNEWHVNDHEAHGVILSLRKEWIQFIECLDDPMCNRSYPIDWMWKIGQTKSIAFQELLAAFLIEPFGSLVDDLSEQMATSDIGHFDPAMPISHLKQLVLQDWGWALDLNFSDPDQQKQFWYVSEAKQEPRLGLRFDEPGAEWETPIDIARQVQALVGDLVDQKGILLDFLCDHPHHRAAVRRVQTLARYPYAEIRDNLVGGTCKPIDMLRFKLAFFGASKFDPKSDRWTRVTLAQGAPLFDELAIEPDWWLAAINPS